MKLKTKLIISFCMIMFVPFLLAGGVLFALTNVQMRQIEKNYGISDVNMIANSIQLMSRCSKDVYQEMCHVAKENPHKLQDQSYLDAINTRLEKNNSYLIVKLEDVFLYCGEPKTLSQMEEVLPEYGEGKSGLDKGIYVGGNIQSLIYQIDFQMSKSEVGSIYLVVSGDQIQPEIKKLLSDGIVAIVLILMVTAVILTIWNYTSIITPIKKLQSAAQNIKDGNLDFTVEVESKDEIGQLCQDFEDMRKRLKESAEEKIESEKENRELISNISHDLKTPITAIKGYVEGIMDGVADTPQKQEKYIRTIYNKANEMNLLINELTFYSKIDTNRIPYNFKKLNLAEYFNDCVEELGLELESKNIRFSCFNYVEENVQIIADPEQLSRVIHNIIGNSIKYLDKKNGCINFRIKDVGDFVQFEIEDNGKGIAAKDLPYIFERFYRADASRNSSTGGSGIGLSIVKKIMEDHGGKIWATSKEKTGTVMYFVLRKYQEVSYSE